MKELFLALLITLSIPMSTWAEDYKKLYLEQRVSILQMELQILQLRYNEILDELPTVQDELIVYLDEIEEEKESEIEEEK